MLFYEESYELPKKYDLRLLPILVIILWALFWKILVPSFAIVLMLVVGAVAILAYRFRSAKVMVTREEIQFEGGTKFLPIPLPQVKQLMTAERRQGGYWPISNQGAAPLTKVVTLPMSLPTYFLINKGVLLERGDPSPFPWVFIPSNDPERMLKSIQDTKRY